MGRIQLRRFKACFAALSIMVVTTTVGAAAITNAPAGAAAKDTTPIIVGGDGDLSISAGVTQGFEAGIYRFNKAGGLDGRKIEYLGFLDDAFSPATNLTNAQELVNSKHVFAIAPFVGQSAGAATGTFLNQNKVPFLGWSTNAAFDTQPKWGFGINGNQGNPAVQGAGGMLQLLAAQGDLKDPSKMKMALIANDLSGAEIANKSLAGVASAEGIDVVYQKAVIAAVGTTNYAPYAQALIASGANVVYEVLGATDSIGVAAALKAAGFKGIVVNGVTYYQGDMPAQGASTVAALQGVYVEDEFPANQNDTPAVVQGEKDLVATGQNSGMTSGTAVGYWTAIVFEQMLRATLAKEGGNPAKVTGATLQQTVAGSNSWVYTDPITGGIGTETFPAAETLPTGCGTLLKTVGNNFKQLEPYKCYYDINVANGEHLNPQTGKKEAK
jgi:ABC-type branched-subunit amino acid transport system substrate-binding protein